MAKKPDVYAKICPSREVLAMIGEKWVSLVALALSEKAHRFGELKKRCEGISQKVLTQTLRKLERDGLVSRKVFPDEMPLKVEYRLTKLGQSLTPIIKESKKWAETNLKTIERAQKSYDSSK